MSSPSQPPRLSRVDFFRFKEEELVFAIAAATAKAFEESSHVQLSDNQQALLAWSKMSIDVPNGGFVQFFFNHGGESGVPELADLLESIEVPKAAAVVRDALAIFRGHEAEFAVANPWDGLFGSIEEFEKPERAFMRSLSACNRAIEKWVRSEIANLALDEKGEPIDPLFTGVIEVSQPNGLVGQYLEVKKGKPHGAYREFFEDGTVRNVVFYKSGKISGDFWPNGKVKRKESTRGRLKIIEFFYPSGLLQKRYVKDKDGYAAEPVRLFHENGQVAEEITTVRGKKHGPWLKFFEDGSPKLKAEYVNDEQLIVHDAWNEDRRQVVKDGAGVFRDDGISIDCEYSVFFEYDWQYEKEVKNGIPHGKATKYHDGVLWERSNYEDGVRHGESKTYWENGRVRCVTEYIHGEGGRIESFPKLDKPEPAVLLKVEANERLYTAWKHIPVDEYPRVLNLDDVQAQLVIPDFLRGVHERNLSGSLKSDYEDCNTFDDGIAYFLSVDEDGHVIHAAANGSGVYSGGNWGAYLPLLSRLRFSPGRIRGRAIECRVLAWVNHTFVEGMPR